MINDLISRSELKKEIASLVVNGESRIYEVMSRYGGEWVDGIASAYREIDNAPTVTPDMAQVLAYESGKASAVRPQGEREFIEILAHYVPDDLCTYPEYRGKPYYSIHYKENGENFVGFGTYKLEVLSGYLKEYFMNCGTDMRVKDELGGNNE